MTVTPNEPVAIIVGGPAGTGKSTVGQMLASKLDAPFLEGDSVHPPENIKKMSNGVPLTDDDRWGWLKDVADRLSTDALTNEPGHIALASCSALATRYRKFLRESVDPQVTLIIVFLWAKEEDIYARVGHRKGHYMGAQMVSSQFKIMEIPEKTTTDQVQNSEEGICIPIEANQVPEVLVGEIMKQLSETGISDSLPHHL